MLPRKYDPSWGWACGLAAVVTAIAWWALPPYSHPGQAYDGMTWVVVLGGIIQMPAAMIIAVFALAVPGGFHNHGDFFRATPFVTWILYTLIIRWLLRSRRGETS